MAVRVLLEPPPARVAALRHRSRIWSFRWLLLFAGIVALGYSGYALLESYLYQTYEDWSFDRERFGKTTDVADFVRDQLPVNAAGDEDKSAGTVSHNPVAASSEAEREPKPDAAGDDSLIGRIAIPRLRVRAIVKEGVDDRTLRRAVGHVPETVRPGMRGNVGLAGHRDSFFRRLREIRKDDRIVIETLDGKYEYEVESMKVVKPNDVQVLAPTEDSVLTLVTCYPFHYVGNAPKRYVVRARQVGSEQADVSVSVATTGTGQAN